jgi:hypothetical protein
LISTLAACAAGAVTARAEDGGGRQKYGLKAHRNFPQALIWQPGS